MEHDITTRLILKLRTGFIPDNFANQEFRKNLDNLGLIKLEPASGFFTKINNEILPTKIIPKIFGRTLFLEFKGSLGRDKIIDKITTLYKKDIVYIEEDEEIVFNTKPITKNQGVKKATSGYPLQTINYSPYNPKGDEVILAIIDSGVNYDHLYLKNSLWTETSSKGGGYGINLTIDGGYSNVKDSHGHGTMIAGIVGAYDNPHVTGIAPSVKLLSVKVFPKRSAKYFVRDAVIAMLFAHKSGAKVINNSWELRNYANNGNNFLTENLRWLEKENCLVVFAAGNNDRDCNKVFPQNLPCVLSVGSVSENLKWEVGTNWGDCISIWAPGNEITSLNYDNSTSIGTTGGTSMAAPFVSGVLALLKAKNPSLTLSDAKKLLKEKGTPIAIPKNKTKSYLLNFSKTLNINNHLKTNSMKTSYPKPPENRKDINKGIFTFLHLERDDIFHLLHNEVDLGFISQFQIFGCFKGNKVIINNEEKFLIEEVALKLVNLNPKSKVLHKIETAKMELHPTNGQVDFHISTVQTKKIKTGIDYTLKQLFLLNFNQVIDYHVNEKANHNGIPCNQVAFF